MSTAEWRRVSRRSPCPVCGKPDWCSAGADGSAVCCMRVESNRRLRNGGWLHWLRSPGERRKQRRIRRAVLPEGGAPATGFGKLAECYREAVKPTALARLASELGVERSALCRLGVGWDGAAWTFPMRNAHGRVVGIRRRFPGGRKSSVRGGREGLFVPSGLPADGLLAIAEGPTDTVAVLTLGQACVGRPSCRGAVALVAEVARGRDVAIIADGDEPGWAGARVLARTLVLHCRSVRVIRPSGGAADVRDWLRRGASREDLQCAIDGAEQWRVCIETTRRPH